MKRMKGFFITATDTGVGKTEVGAYIAKMFFEKGLKVAVMKPVASGVNKICKDAEILRRMSSSRESFDHINPVALKLPLAPLVAYRLEKKNIDMKVVWERFRRLSKNNDLTIVEGIGGLMVPIYKKENKVFYVLDMILKMRLPVIVVTRPNLGTINHTLMTLNILKNNKVNVAGIIFNHTSRVKRDISEKTNPGIIEELSGVKVLGVMGYNKDRDKRRIKWLKKIEPRFL
jgi:dethiobiotin synthetase